jgi:hypothetical protein
MKRKRLLFIAPLAILGLAAFLFLGGEIVKLLWNWLLPPLFGWKMINFWQAFALLALCRILFGHHGWRSHGSGRRLMRDRMSDRWRHMTPEQRERMRSRWKMACGFEPPAPEAPTTEGVK